MKDKVFIDTNVLVYAYNSDDPEKQKIAKKLLSEVILKNDVYISSQILNEFYSVLSKYKVDHYEIKQYVNEVINSTKVLPVSVLISKNAFTIKEEYQYSWWDSLVLSSALECNCNFVYSEDMQHGQIIENTLKIINPFL